MIALLIERGADVDKASEGDGRTPLFAAAWVRSLRVLQVLLTSSLFFRFALKIYLIVDVLEIKEWSCGCSDTAA